MRAGKAQGHLDLYAGRGERLHQRPGQAPGLHGEGDFFAVLVYRQAIETGRHKVDVLLGEQRGSGKSAHGGRTIRQQMPMPCAQIEKRVEALVVIVIKILHRLRRAAAVDNIFKVIRSERVGGKA